MFMVVNGVFMIFLIFALHFLKFSAGVFYYFDGFQRKLFSKFCRNPKKTPAAKCFLNAIKTRNCSKKSSFTDIFLKKKNDQDPPEDGLHTDIPH